jgi:acetate CoA/acetoacetate CoA-transferase beta subunit
MEPSTGGLILQELAPGVDVTTLQQATDTRLIVPDHVPFIDLD